MPTPPPATTGNPNYIAVPVYYTEGNARENVITFSRRHVQPPSDLYVGPETILRLSVFGSVAGLTLTCRIRTLRPNGEILRTEFDVPSSSDRSNATTTINLAEGFLLSVLVSAPAGVSRGMCWVLGRIAIGTLTTNLVFQPLFSDYVTTLSHVGWPHTRVISSVEGAGTFRYIQGTTPAVQANIVETVPTGARWRLHSLFATCTTSSGTAQTINMQLSLGGVMIGRFVAPSSQTGAGITVGYTFAGLGNGYSGGPGGVTTQHVPIPPEIILPAGATITIAAFPGLGALDHFSAPAYAVEEWIE